MSVSWRAIFGPREKRLRTVLQLESYSFGKLLILRMALGRQDELHMVLTRCALLASPTAALARPHGKLRLSHLLHFCIANRAA